MVGVAVKLTLIPAQILEVPAILTDGVVAGLMVMVIAFEVAVLMVKQEALEVSTHVTTSPLANEDELKVFELVPALTPFTFH